MKINQLSTSGYRADIDCLRAIAVLLVLAYHAGLPPFSAGFVGVDVFFVISGFVITKSISRELDSSCFSLFRFYRRRLLRIAPAASLVALVTFVVGLIISPPEELRLLGNSMIAAAVSLANIYFWNSAGYFDTASASKPLLHLWSLSVEEQFYFLFPITLVFLFKARRPYAERALVAGLFISFGWSEVLVRADPTAAYFSLQSRAWELLIGSILGLGVLPKTPESMQASAPFLGVLLILGSAIGYTEKIPFPGAFALVPCIGALLFISAGDEDSRDAKSKVFSIAPLAYVGRISFSLYLWHWPILVFGSMALNRPLTVVEGALGLLLTFVLSALSYRFVEQPFRQQSPGPAAVTLKQVTFKMSGAVCLLAAVGAAGSAARLTSGFPGRAPLEALAANAAMTDLSNFAKSCFSTGSELRGPTGCLSGPSASRSEYDVIVWGDSHAEHIFPAVAEAAAITGRTARLIAKSACPPLMHVRANLQRDPGAADDCAAFVARAREAISDEPPTTILVLAGAWSDWTNVHFLTDDTQMSQSASESARVLASALFRTVASISVERPMLVVRQTPVFPKSPARCGARAGMLRQEAYHCYSELAEVATERLKFSNAAIDHAVASHRGVKVFDPATWLCEKTTCRARAEDIILYRDAGHLTSAGSRWLGRHVKLP